MSLKGKTAVVTGSTSGIGYAIALALAKDGCNIVVNGLGTEQDNAKAIAEVKKLGTRVTFDPANMLRHNQIADCAEHRRDADADSNRELSTAEFKFLPVAEFAEKVQE